MSHRGPALRLADMLGAAEQLTAFSAGLTAAQLDADVKTRSAILFCFTVLGEAANSIAPEDQGRFDGIPWDEIRRMRNFVVHVYFGVKADRLLETIRTDVPPLTAALRSALASLPPN